MTSTPCPFGEPPMPKRQCLSSISNRMNVEATEDDARNETSSTMKKQQPTTSISLESTDVVIEQSSSPLNFWSTHFQKLTQRNWAESWNEFIDSRRYVAPPSLDLRAHSKVRKSTRKFNSWSEGVVVANDNLRRWNEWRNILETNREFRRLHQFPLWENKCAGKRYFLSWPYS